MDVSNLFLSPYMYEMLLLTPENKNVFKEIFLFDHEIVGVLLRIASASWF